MLVLQNDEVVFEEYWDEHDTAISNSFSSAKSVITLLTQIAVQDGYIGSR